MSEMPIFCNQCGASNVAQARFCSACGAPLAAAPAVPNNQPPLLPPPPPAVHPWVPVVTSKKSAAKKPITCGGCFMIFLAVFVVMAIIGSIVGPPENEVATNVQRAKTTTESAAEQKQRQAAVQKQRREVAARHRVDQEKQAAGRAAKRRIERIVRRELESYEKAGSNWRNILIRRNTSQDDLIKLARKLHQEDPTSYFRFLDNDEEFQQYMDWDKNYPDDNYPYPKEWTEKHYIAMINQMSGTWSLHSRIGETIATLE